MKVNEGIEMTKSDVQKRLIALENEKILLTDEIRKIKRELDIK